MTRYKRPGVFARMSLLTILMASFVGLGSVFAYADTSRSDGDATPVTQQQGTPAAPQSSSDLDVSPVAQVDAGITQTAVTDEGALFDEVEIYEPLSSI